MVPSMKLVKPVSYILSANAREHLRWVSRAVWLDQTAVSIPRPNLFLSVLERWVIWPETCPHFKMLVSIQLYTNQLLAPVTFLRASVPDKQQNQRNFSCSQFNEGYFIFSLVSFSLICLVVELRTKSWFTAELLGSSRPRTIRPYLHGLIQFHWISS